MGSLKFLFGGEDHHGFPHLQKLHLGYTDVVAEDIVALHKTLQDNK